MELIGEYWHELAVKMHELARARGHFGDIYEILFKSFTTRHEADELGYQEQI